MSMEEQTATTPAATPAEKPARKRTTKAIEKVVAKTVNKIMGKVKKAKIKAKPKEKADPEQTAINQSKATKSSWKDAAVRAKRCERTKVRVGGVEYRSAGAAMVALKLPTKNVIKFRMELKDTGRKTYSHDGTDYIFTVVN